MSFDKYRLPLGLTEGTRIDLPDTDAFFVVLLPCSSNEEFMSKLMATLNVHVDEKTAAEGLQFDINPGEFQDTRKKLFFENCVLSCEGLPEGMTQEEFFKEFQLAKTYLFNEAIRLAEQADQEISSALGNSPTTANGRTSGLENTNSTISL